MLFGERMAWGPAILVRRRAVRLRTWRATDDDVRIKMTYLIVLTIAFASDDLNIYFTDSHASAIDGSMMDLHLPPRPVITTPLVADPLSTYFVDSDCGCEEDWNIDGLVDDDRRCLAGTFVATFGPSLAPGHASTVLRFLQVFLACSLLVNLVLAFMLEHGSERAADVLRVQGGLDRCDVSPWQLPIDVESGRIG